MDYPANIPCPLRAGYGITAENNIIRSQMANGRAIQRVQYTYIPAYADLSFLFTEAEAQIFKTWADTVGCGWFTVKLKTPLGYYDHECRFMESPVGPSLIGVSLWGYKVKTEIRERVLLDISYGEFYPGVVLMSDIFDIAMNREWPT